MKNDRSTRMDVGTRVPGHHGTGSLPVSFFLELMDCVDDFVILLDGNLRIIKANRNSAIVTGFAEEDLVRMKLTELLDSKERRRVARMAEETEGRRGGRTVFRTQSGKRLSVDFSISRMKSPAEAEVLFLFVGRPKEGGVEGRPGDATRDLQGRLLDSFDEPLFMVDFPTRAIVECNQYAVDLSGYDRGEMLGRGLNEFLSSSNEIESAEVRMAAMDDSYARKGFHTRKFRFARKDRTMVPVEMFSIPIVRDNGSVDTTMAILVDRSVEERHQVMVAEFSERASKFASDFARFTKSSEERPESKRLSALGFTPRQIEIARLVSEGCPSKEIGYKLGIAESTVKNHLAAMFKKIGATSRVDFLHKLVKQRIWIA